MKKLFFFSLAGILISSFSFAKIFRVGYNGPKIPGVDFADLQSAHDAAAVGDTLMFYPGGYSMNRADKRLVYLGFGYYLSGVGSNQNLQHITGDLNITLYLNNSASGSIFEGIDNLNVASYFEENVNNITVRRCRQASINVFNSTGTTCDNWRISQCASLAFSGSWSGGKATNLRVDNCVLTGFNTGGSTGHTGLFNNCIFTPINVDISNSTLLFQNSIFYGGNVFNFSNSIFQHCIFDHNNPGLSGSNNVFNISFWDGNNNLVFMGYPTTNSGQSEDGKFKLKPGSPAIGVGIGGIDLGIFGGPNPYRLSGIPSIPTIYKLEASSINATTNPFTVTFSTRSNN
jgi:hypothetical protein